MSEPTLTPEEIAEVRAIGEKAVRDAIARIQEAKQEPTSTRGVSIQNGKVSTFPRTFIAKLPKD